ncbi:glycoside hydrolase family 16 protein, partial [Alteromonas sp. 14N.309.X.WAT.G.H12]|uniref:glycoside hydrolase family 16 protein n=1 Tax=Alteromonas sp. 14N.309.X.WAT.G.H12 TaxID=3120824 RepID=UPI003B626F46
MTKNFIQITRIAAAISVTSLFGCGESAKTSTDVDGIDISQPSGWELVWHDEFEGGAIDENYWTYEVNCDGGGNNEAQCYTDNEENAFVDEGILNIVALPAEEGA